METAELLLLAKNAGGEMQASVSEKWVSAEDGKNWKLTNEGKIISCFDGKIYEWKDGEFYFLENVVEAEEAGEEPNEKIDETNGGKKYLRLTLLPRVGYVKTENDEKFLELAEIRNPGFLSFAAKWEIETKHLRHLTKLDTFFIDFIIRHFDAKKSKPRNALLKYSETLSRFPQRWRKMGIQETTGLEEMILNPDESVAIGGSSEFKIRNSVDEVCEIFSLDGDFFIQVKQGSVSVDGSRASPEDGPVFLRDSTTLRIDDDIIFIQLQEDSRKKKIRLV